jgi:hypothetical protein
MTHLSPFAFISAGVVVLCWWFGLYILTLYSRSLLARSLGVAIALLGVMGLGETMVMISSSVEFFVLGWGVVFVSSSLLPVLWLQINVFLLPEDQTVWLLHLLRLGYLFGTTFALLGACSNSLFDYTTLDRISGSWKPFGLQPGILAVPWHLYLIAYLGVVIALGPRLFCDQVSVPDCQKRRLRILFRLAACAFEGAACYAAAEAALWMYGIELPVWGVQTFYGVGVGVLVMAVLRHALFTQGRRPVRASAYSLVATVGLSILYSGVLLMVQGVENTSALTIFLLVVLVVSTHMLFDWGRAVLDRVFFEDVVARVRRDLRMAINEVALAPNLESALEQIETCLSRERFTEMIRDALRSRGDQNALAGYARRLRLVVVERRAQEMSEQKQPLTDMDRGRALWDLLVEAIEHLRPTRKRTLTTLAWRHYLALKLGYVEGWTNRRVARELNVSLRTLDRDRNAAATAVAKIVWELEERVGSEMAQVDALMTMDFGYND